METDIRRNLDFLNTDILLFVWEGAVFREGATRPGRAGQSTWRARTT
jgi:hypothetical protein